MASRSATPDCVQLGEFRLRPHQLSGLPPAAHHRPLPGLSGRRPRSAGAGSPQWAGKLCSWSAGITITQKPKGHPQTLSPPHWDTSAHTRLLHSHSCLHCHAFMSCRLPDTLLLDTGLTCTLSGLFCVPMSPVRQIVLSSSRLRRRMVSTKLSPAFCMKDEALLP